MSEPRRLRQAVPVEDLAAEVEQLMSLAAERGIAARNARERNEVATTQHPDIPDISAALSAELLSILEDEVVPTAPAGPPRNS